MKVLKRILLGCTLLLSVNVSAEDRKPTYWQDLVPQLETVQDPFAHLDNNQLYDLATIARFRDAQKIKGFKASAESLAEMKSIEASLVDAGIDVQDLFLQRDLITEQRRKLATLPNQKILNKAHRIPGFITPIEMDGNKVTKFFLVPTAGACIHTPPPPPNQIVLVDYPDGIELVSLQTPVWVEGDLFNQKVSADVNYSDGASNVEAVYQMSAGNVEQYQPN
ncbi:hypothetical protein A9264_03205 [Vibrio sp. UCD-FRSSP16_10]|uniref:DUF3299 domain-containing protein n=1 Tax=unclassified Vibrio TaxID=2614977 RepID=UPI0007FB8E67|nr:MULTISPECIES: DUF3299 domain-containing protein [unclassified Vibrio]OBT12158.1 hypothetical protein A9260_04655 [Vibrio sp. UCD-FRSSP16_30]OBT20489.1 hypothetical protein A9264_03205 [Vibrio sp. UCD-FRSSP16_10]